MYSLHQYSWILALPQPHGLPAHELWVENRSKHLLPGPDGLETRSKHLLPGLDGLETHSEHLLPSPDGLETDFCPKAFSNSLDLVTSCLAYVLSGAWKLQLPRNHTREALYSPRIALSPPGSNSSSFCARRGPRCFFSLLVYNCVLRPANRCQCFDTNVTKCVL